MRNITDDFIDQLDKLRLQKRSDEEIKQVKRVLLDYLGVTFAGAKMLSKRSISLLQDLNGNERGAIVIGLNRKANLGSTALINGLHSHVAELDDGDRYGMFHPGAPLFSVLLPLAEMYEEERHNFFDAIITGYEASVLLARSMQPETKDKGFHGTGIFGTVGAAIAAGVFFGFSKDKLKHTLGAAATSASGLLKVIKDGSEMKPFNVATASQNALNAVLLVKAGFQGPDDVLAGDKGLLGAFKESYNPDRLLQELNNNNLNPAIFGIYMKPYAACRHAHPAVEAAITLKEKHNIDPDSIEKITVSTYYWAVEGHDHTDIKGVGSAKMSTPYSVAVGYIRGKAGLNEFREERIKDQNVLSLTRRVSVYEDNELSELVPDKRGAIVVVKTTNNELYSYRIDLPKGEPETRLTDEELRNKFSEMLTYAEIPDRAVKIIDAVEELNKNSGLSKLFALL